MLPLVAGDIADVVTTATAGLGGEITTVAVAGVTLGAIAFGIKKVWRVFKSLSN